MAGTRAQRAAERDKRRPSAKDRGKRPQGIALRRSERQKKTRPLQEQPAPKFTDNNRTHPAPVGNTLSRQDPPAPVASKGRKRNKKPESSAGETASSHQQTKANHTHSDSPRPQRSGIRLEGSIYIAPPRCEECNRHLPTQAERLAHMKKTKHCSCFECQGYMPPGLVYAHWCQVHSNIKWNDHAAAWEDKESLKRSMPWVQSWSYFK